MYSHANVTTAPEFPVPDTMKAWVLGDPGQLIYAEKATPVPGRAEVLVRIDAVAICATDLDVIHHGPPAMIQGGLLFNKRFTPGHEYMGTVTALGAGVSEYAVNHINTLIHIQDDMSDEEATLVETAGFTASAAREKVQRTEPRRSCDRNGSMRRKSTPIRFRSRNCPQRCAMLRIVSMTRSRSW